MNSKYILFCFILSYPITAAFGQEGSGLIEQLIENTAEQAGENYDYSELYERLNNFQRNPINLNTASKEQLKSLFFLSPVQIEAILNYREKNGAFIELMELQNVKGLDLETIRNLLPFITLSRQSSVGLSAAGKHEAIFRLSRTLEKQQGYLIPDTSGRSRYLGSPHHLLTRYRFNSDGRLSMGLVMEKDAGEGFFSNYQKKGFDFYSGYIALSGTSKIRKIVLGDYSLQFGQGLSLWSGLSFNRGIFPTAAVKQDIGLRPYSSANETMFFRGASATVSFSKISITPFISYRFIDADLKENGTDETEISSAGKTGFHRTVNENVNKNSVSQFVIGTAVHHENQNLKIGVNAYHTTFSHPFQPGRYLYNQFGFTGSSLINLGLYYNYSWRNIYFFGEAAHSLYSGYALLTSALANLSNEIALVLLYRNYQKDYHSFFNQTMAASSSGVNEKGFYTGITIRPTEKLELSAYSDIFRFPWLKYRTDAPSKGTDFFTQLTYNPSKQLRASLRYRTGRKEENDEIDNTINFLETVQRQQYRAELDYKINENFRLRNRIEMVQYQKGDAGKEFGYMIFQDVLYNPLLSRFSANTRFAVFDTQGFNSRIYAYENDVLYSFSAPAFQNRGTRFYLNGKFTIRKNTDLWFRYAITKYINRDEIGSGLDKIEGSKKSDIRVQLRVQF